MTLELPQNSKRFWSIQPHCPLRLWLTYNLSSTNVAHTSQLTRKTAQLTRPTLQQTWPTLQPAAQLTQPTLQLTAQLTRLTAQLTWPIAQLEVELTRPMAQLVRGPHSLWMMNSIHFLIPDSCSFWIYHEQYVVSRLINKTVISALDKTTKRF